MKELMNSLGLNISPGAQQLMGQIERQQQQVKADFHSVSVRLESLAKIYIKYVNCYSPAVFNRVNRRELYVIHLFT